METSIADYRIGEWKKTVHDLPWDVMFVGVTGAGKSSTINALLGADVAKVGFGVNPETDDVVGYKLNDYVTLWDTPGLGDSPERDAEHLKKIEEKLSASKKQLSFMRGMSGLHSETVRYTIDMVVVVIDGSNRDLGAVTSLLNGTIFRLVASKNVIFVINQADMAKSGRHWDSDSALPDETLSDFLKQQAQTVRKRIEESTGKKINQSICYSATEDFNLKALIDYIIAYKSPRTGEKGNDDGFAEAIAEAYRNQLRQAKE